MRAEHPKALRILSWVTHPQNKLTHSISPALQPSQTASPSVCASAPEIQRANCRWEQEEEEDKPAKLASALAG